MTLAVDWSRLETRRSQWSSLGTDGAAEDEETVELWVTLPGLSDDEGEQRVLAAADEAWPATPGSTRAVTGSAGGVYVARTVPSGRWRSAIDSLVDELQHSDGTVTTPPPVPSNLTAGRLVAQAFLAFSMSPPPQEGPFNPNGTLKLRWGVDPGLTRRLVEDACEWAAGAGRIGRVGPFLPATPESAARAVMRTWYPGNFQHSVLFASDHTGTRARAVALGEFGLTSWTDLAPDTAPVDQASALIPLMVKHAPSLDYAHIGPGNTTLRVDRDPATQGVWRGSRELWATHVPAPYSVQLLTSAHLDRVHDLSGWDVRQVAPGRWLVMASDLRPWWNFPEATTVWEAEAAIRDVAAPAKRAFGDAVLRP